MRRRTLDSSSPTPLTADLAQAQRTVDQDGATPEDDRRFGDRVLPERKHLTDWGATGPVDDHADRSAAVVLEQVNDGPLEGVLGEQRRGDEQPSRRRFQPAHRERRQVVWSLGGHSHILPRSRTRCATRRNKSLAASYRQTVHYRGHLRVALARRDFRRLLFVRLLGQFGDGVFQISLAGAVLFNPERQAHAAEVAAGFAVILLPYCLVGPFAGVLLDRWWRQRVLVLANLVRAVLVLGVAAEVAAGVDNQLFYVSALVVVSVNRFFLSTLSASLPHVVNPPELVTANALSTTCGGIAATLGGGFGIAIRALAGDTNVGYGIVGALALLPYVASALTARGFARVALGPDDVHRCNRETMRAVAAGLVAGAQYVARLRPVCYAFTVIGIYRFCYGILTITTLLLYRNYLPDDGFFRNGLAGLAQVVLGVAVGSALAAIVTPPVTRRLGFVRWASILLMTASLPPSA